MSQDSDIASYWKAHKERRRAKKQQNIHYSTQMLKDAGIEFTVHNNGVHFRIGKYIDFWPGTGKWLDHAHPIPRRGVKGLIDYCQKQGTSDGTKGAH